MKKYLILLVTILTSIQVSAQNIRRDTVTAKSKLRADDKFVWQNLEIYRDSLAYILWEADSFRFKRVDGSWSEWFKPGTGSGEENTVSSQGSGVSIFYQKSGVDLQFNGIKSENSILSIALDGVSHDVELTVDETSINHNNLLNYSIDQHRIINDGGSGTTELWSADKISSELAGKEPTLTKGNLTETGTNILTITGGTGAVIGPGTTIEVELATNQNSGYLSNTDWVTFNGKQDALSFGDLTEAASNILTITGGSGSVIGAGTTIQVEQATGSTSGYLSSSDWNTFNNKVSNAIHSGDVSGSTTLTIGDDTVLESHLKAVNAQTDEYVLTYEATTGDFEWQSGGAGSGETNTASSQGTGIPIFYQKSDVDLQFNAIKSENSLLSVALDGVTHDVELTLNESLINHNNLSNYSIGEHRTINDAGSCTSIQVSQATSSTSGYLSSADWNTFNNKVSNATHTGDVIGSTSLTIGNDKVLESHLKAVNSPTDEYVLTYESTTGDFEWQQQTGGTASLERSVNQSSHGFSVDNAIYKNGSTYAKALGNDPATAGVIGIVTEVTDANNFTYTYGGTISGSWTDATDYFLSNTVAGSIVTEPSYNSGDVRLYIGTGTEDGLQLEIDVGHEIVPLTDNTAVHTDGVDEISSLTSKASPVSNDILVIEDSESGYVKKKVLISNLPGGSESDPIYSSWDKSTGISISASQVSDFDTEVSNNSTVTANAAKVSYPGSADATELNILDGATINTAELNYLDNVTSDIQSQLNSKLSTLPNVTKSITVEDPTGSENICMFYVPEAMTISHVYAVVSGTSPSVTINQVQTTDRSAAGTGILSSATAITNTTSGQTLTSFNDATVPSGSWIVFKTTATSGTVDEISVTITFNID
jgi:hypothetical protein